MFEKENVHLEQQQSVAFGDINKEPSAALRPLWENFHGLFNAMENVAIKFRRMELYSDKIEGLEKELAAANQELLDRSATIESLNRRKPRQTDDGSEAVGLFRAELEEIVPKLVKGPSSLSTVLQIVAVTFPHRITVLDSSFESARQSESFLYVEQAFDLLWRLATSYWDEIQTKGDVEARKQFGKSYSAKEKSTLSKSGEDRRTFVYASKPLRMDKHLKIGTADNQADTLRIHFEWVAEEKRIVIGHCGKHLDF
jgi:dsDNA-binding SOS-regulon protein